MWLVGFGVLFVFGAAGWLWGLPQVVIGWYVVAILKRRSETLRLKLPQSLDGFFRIATST